MKPWVMDASAALGLALGDGDGSLARQVSERLQLQSATVPQHWPLEVNNGLLMASRRGRLPPDQVVRAQALLLELPVSVDTGTADRCWSTTYALAQRFGLTVYDAAYLELALREEAELATADRQLAQAARQAGVTVMGPQGGEGQ